MSASKLIFGTLNALVLVSGALQSFRERHTLLYPSSRTIMFSSLTIASKIFSDWEKYPFLCIIGKTIAWISKGMRWVF